MLDDMTAQHTDRNSFFNPLPKIKQHLRILYVAVDDFRVRSVLEAIALKMHIKMRCCIACAALPFLGHA